MNLILCGGSLKQYVSGDDPCGRSLEDRCRKRVTEEGRDRWMDGIERVAVALRRLKSWRNGVSYRGVRVPRNGHQPDPGFDLPTT